MRWALRGYGLARGMTVVFDGDAITITRRGRSIRLNPLYPAYVRDLVDEFEVYFSAVHGGGNEVDYSAPREHRLAGWDLFPSIVPGLPEPMQTITQYIDLTGMRPGQSVLDLGAYAGITGCAFMEVVGPSGKVVSVEADPVSLSCARENIDRYASLRGHCPQLLEGAVWSENGTLTFSAESSLGSAVSSVLTRSVVKGIQVPSFTLSDIMDKAGLHKADIEGAEFWAFSDADFFSKHHPILIFEPALNSLRETNLEAMSELLGGYGYSLTLHEQVGSRLPLVVCV
jgi:FkbM family methyltransferase